MNSTKWDVVAHTCNSNTGEAEEGGTHWRPAWATRPWLKKKLMAEYSPNQECLPQNIPYHTISLILEKRAKRIIL
jgi:hypothetical protein